MVLFHANLKNANLKVLSNTHQFYNTEQVYKLTQIKQTLVLIGDDHNEIKWNGTC